VTKQREAINMRFFIAIFLFVTSTIVPAGEVWETLSACRLAKEDYMDGDSFHVECGGKNYQFRLYFVDCPETDNRFPDRIRDQSQHFGITPDQSIKVGFKAKEFTKRMLHRPFTVLTRWYNARGASAQERFYAVVLCDGKNLAEELVAAGFARPFGMRANFPDGPRSKDFIANLKRLEGRAMRSRVGAWSKSELDDQFVSTDLTPEQPYPKPESDPPLTTPSDPFDQIASQTESYLESFASQSQQPTPQTESAKLASNHHTIAQKTDSLVNINTASQTELEQLPGIGPALAERIVSSRPFAKTDDIRKVKGIGDKTFNLLAPLIRAE
jgi:competence ComEA-like helix-hairpin-helix protein